ncbi:hypothetical protein ACO1O0_006937 [Amphichorda felina]
METIKMECGGGLPVVPDVPDTSRSKTDDDTAQIRETSQPNETRHSHQTLDGLAARPARRKLRKCAPKPKSLSSVANKRGSQDSTASSTFDCGGRLATPQPIGDQRPSVPIPPDLSDSKWLQYLERGGLVSSPELPLDPGSRAGFVADPPPQLIIPEFSNLALNRCSSGLPLGNNTNTNNNSSSSFLKPSAMNRPRKTLSKRSLMGSPFKIAQLDGSAPRRKEIRVIKRRASIELIAEQYQAFLESRDARDELEESEYEARQEDDGPRLQPTQFDPGLDHPREVFLDAPGPEEPDSLSPASDCTLVAFEEEDAIYFKPISFSSPEPSPHPERHSFDKPLPRPPSDPGIQPLQACISMLVKELTSAMPVAAGGSSQALQISAMIEAYERLRDQVEATGMGESEERSVRSMFDCWLAALHTMHRSYTRGAVVNERQCEDLAVDVD